MGPAEKLEKHRAGGFVSPFATLSTVPAGDKPVPGTQCSVFSLSGDERSAEGYALRVVLFWLPEPRTGHLALAL